MRDLQAGLEAALTTARPWICAKLCASLLEASELSTAVLGERLARHRRGLAEVREAVHRLCDIEEMAALSHAATVELCATCGFNRAVLTSIVRSSLVVRSVHVANDPELAARALEVGVTLRPHLDRLPVEADMIRRRAPTLLADVQSRQRAQPPFVTLLNASGYVAAPIISGKHSVGFLHADLDGGARALDEIDRDRLWMFAEGLGCAIERACLNEHLRVALDRTEGVRTAHNVLPTRAGLEFRSVAYGGNLAPEYAGVSAPRGEPSASANTGHLTQRERGVLALIVEGATNAAIGERLVISQGTVKSHVANILRKLGAANRADAVARYLQAARAS
jgi:DNA-binding CsgD family transcriptional regulator